ncbi:MAG: hypothetical protein OEM79_01165 [Nitrosopumilus sp.]|nr:hypothetical protein [Nitrosopumilus sp.]
MKFTTNDILKGMILLGCIAHVMVYFNGFWNDALWVSAMLVVAIPAILYKYLSSGKKTKRSTRLSKEI